MDIAHLRKQLRFAIEAGRRDAATRRARADEASRHYAAFLEQVATPVFRGMATALRAEGFPFDVMTPSGGVRLVSERHRDDVIALDLDEAADPPMPVVTITRTRGRRVLQHERPIRPGVPSGSLTDADVTEMLLDELRPWLER